MKFFYHKPYFLNFFFSRQIESKGPRFELGDFVIKLGSVTLSQNFKGVMIEVEYRPCLIPSNCWELIREFMQGFMGAHVIAAIPPYFANPSSTTINQTKQNDIYQPIDTVQQYLEHFTNYRKLNSHPMSVGSVGSGGSDAVTSNLMSGGKGLRS